MESLGSMLVEIEKIDKIYTRHYASLLLPLRLKVSACGELLL